MGTSGTVYLRIPEGGTGQVSVSIKGSLRQYDAKSVDGSMIANEETVTVKAVVGTILIVEPMKYAPKKSDLPVVETQKTAQASYPPLPSGHHVPSRPRDHPRCFERHIVSPRSLCAGGRWRVRLQLLGC